MVDNSEEVGSGKPEAENKHPLSILLVEDDEAMALRIERALNGHKVTVFDNVDQALEKLRESQKLGTPFDWIITDKGLVGNKDGGFVLARAVKDEQLGNPFVTLFTGDASEVQQQNSEQQLKEKGIHEVIGKPFKRQVFLDSIGAVREFRKQFQSPQPQKI